MSLTTQTESQSQRPKSRISSPVTSPPGTPSQKTLSHAIGPNALSLGYALMNAMRCVESTICLVFQRSSTSTPRHELAEKDDSESWVTSQLAAIHEADERLVAARDAARELLRRIFEDFHMAVRVAQNRVPTHKESYQGSVAIISLLQVSISLFNYILCTHNVTLYTVLDGPRNASSPPNRRKTSPPLQPTPPQNLAPPSLSRLARCPSWTCHR